MALDDQTAWDMTDEDTTQGQQSVLPGGVNVPQGTTDNNALIRQMSQLYAQLQQPVSLPSVPPRASPDDGTRPGFLGLLGEALAGGQSPLYKLRGQQEDLAGSRALLNFGIGMMLGSGPSIVKPSLFSAAAQGLQGAQQSMDTSQQQAYAQAGQQFEQQRQLAALGIQQQDVNIKKLAAALPFLRLQGAAGLQSPFGQQPGTTPPAGPGGYAGAIAGIEGTGRNAAGTSSAQGVGQFTDATWSDFVQANPQMFAGMTPQQIQAARADPQIGTAAINWLAQRNAGLMKNFGAPATGQSLGIAHFLGAGAAAAVMNAPDGMPVSAFVSPEAVKANPQLATMTVGQLKQRYANVPNPAFLGGTQYAGPGVPPATTTAPVAARPAGPPGVQVGGPVPAPPGAPAGTSTAPYTGGGIGSVPWGRTAPAPAPAPATAPPTQGNVVVPRGPQLASNAPIAPPVGPALPPSPAVAGDVQAMLAGIQNARPTLAGGTATAGPGARAAPVGGFGVTAAGQPVIGDYNNAPASAAPPTTPPAVPPVVPPAPTTATAPAAPPKEVPDEQLSLPQYIAKYKQPLTPEQVKAATVGGDTATNKELADQAAVVQNAQEAADKAKQTYDIAQRAAAQGITGMGDVNKSLSDLNTANAAAADAKNKYNQLVQQADTATASNLVQLDKTQTDQLSAAYKDMLDRYQKAALQAQAEKAAVSKSGQDVAFGIDKKRLDNMTDQASSAHTTAINLESMASIMNNLPTGGEADVMAYLSPSQTAWLRDAGIISGDHADAAAVFNGLKNYLSVQMRPVGSGALRGAEMDRFQASLPDMLTSPAGRQKALAFMQAYVNRVQQEADYATDYYSRPGTGGAPAYNLRGLNDAMNAPKSQGGLGEVIPHAPPMNASRDEHNAFLGGIERGAPYYGWQQNPKSGQWEQQLMVK